MKTKKITALVLAALMAAGTTATAFADCDVVNAGGDKDAKRPLTFNDETIYENEDGVLTPSTDFRPGDTLYIRLDELNANGDKKIEDEKDDMNVYADWKVGKDAVESVDIVYKKGNYPTSMEETTFTYTVDGVPFKIEGKDIQHDLNSAIKAQLTKHQKENPDFLKDEIAAELARFEAKLYVVSGTYYPDAEEALVKAGWKKVAVQVGDGTGAVSGYTSVDELVKDDCSATQYTGNPKAYYSTQGDKDNGYGVYSSADGNSVGELSDDCYIFGSGPYNFIDVSAIDTAKKLNSTGLISDVVRDMSGESYYVKNEGDTPKSVEDALAQAVDTDKNISVVDGYIVGGTMTQPEDAKDMAVASIIANEVVNVNTTVDRTYKNNYTYWVEIKTKEDDTTKVLDLAGVLRIGSTKNKAEDVANAFQLDTSLDNRVYDSGAYVTVEDEWTFAPDSRSVVKFSDDAEDVVLYFGENEAAWFEFDARGQSALNLEFTFDFNKEIADLFPEANIDFLTFTSKPATNRTGDLYIVADEDTYLYEVTDDGVKTVAYLPAGGTGSAAVSAALGVKNINGAEYDEKEGAWHIRTRKLGAYAISDTELDTSRTLDGDEPSSESGNSGNNNGTKPIPDTGR